MEVVKLNLERKKKRLAEKKRKRSLAAQQFRVQTRQSYRRDGAQQQALLGESWSPDVSWTSLIVGSMLACRLKSEGTAIRLLTMAGSSCW